MTWRCWSLLVSYRVPSWHRSTASTVSEIVDGASSSPESVEAGDDWRVLAKLTATRIAMANQDRIHRPGWLLARGAPGFSKCRMALFYQGDGALDHGPGEVSRRS